MEAGPKQVRGAQLGLSFPTNLESLREQGADFLTAAFRATGAIDANNCVTAITGFEEFFGGGAGRKALLSVAYERPAGLHRDLFVKYPRDFGDSLRPLFSHLMEPETRFALLSRQASFPIVVPRCYFADYDPETASGILITERIGFGRDGIEPFIDKCLDDELAEPQAHYRALIRTVARLSAFHKSGRFGPDLERQFPHDPSRIRDDDRIPYTPDVLEQKLVKLREFAGRHPGLMPKPLRSPAFFDRFSSEAPRFLEAELPIKRYLNAQKDFIALSHWNANLDNAWFWRTPEGELEAGLLDWGSVSQMNVAQAIFGVLCACETDFWNVHKRELVQLFADEYASHGGPVLDVDQLDFQVQLFVAMLGLAWMMDAPSIIRAQLPDLDQIRSRHDPRLRGDFLARAQLQLMVVFLNAWETGNFGTLLGRLPTLA